MTWFDRLAEWANGLLNRLAEWANWFIRMFDFRVNRTFDLQLPLLSARGYSMVTTTLLVPAFFLLIAGPSPIAADRFVLAIAALASILIVVVLCALPFRLQFVVWPTSWLVALAVWGWAGDNTEIGGGPYRHLLLIYFPMILTLSAAAPLLAKLLIWWFELVKDDQQRQPKYRWANLLTHRDLVVVHERARFKWYEFVGGLVQSLFAGTSYKGRWPRYWLQLLFFPAIAVIIAPADYVVAWGTVVFVVVWVLHSLACVFCPLQQILMITRRCTVLGPLPFCLAIAAITLAALRLLNVSYVVVFVDSAKSMTILCFGLSLYVGVWLFEGLNGQALARELLRVIDNGLAEPQLKYDLARGVSPAQGFSSISSERTLQTHGTRFVVIGKSTDGEGQETYAKASLFKHLAAIGEQVGSPDDYRSNVIQGIVYGYYIALDLIVLVALAVILFLHVGPRQVNPILDLPTAQASSPMFSLEDSLRQGADERVLLISASGGGTRAAIHAAAVMQGLAEIDALDDTVLFSGVSGGSGAVAAVLLDFERLTRHMPSESDEEDRLAWKQAWSRCSRLVASPFIDDVVRGTAEWRTIRREGISRLLAESFAYRFPNTATMDSLGRASTGCVFNTTIAAHPNLGDSSPYARSQLGGRLVLSNVDEASAAFPLAGYPNHKAPQSREADLRLPYKVVQHQSVPLTTAAALSANFPPVFPNAEIRINGEESYYVTDGGVVDNRGTLSLLYLLRHSLKCLSPEEIRQLPEIHVVMINSSRNSLVHSSDRGVGSIIGTSGQLSAQLTAELLAEIELLCCDDSGETALHVHYIQLPDVFCRDSGLTTHWMLPPRVTLSDPENPSRQKVFSGEVVRQLIVELYAAKAAQGLPALETDLNTARRWAQTDPSREAWKVLIEQLSVDNRR